MSGSELDERLKLIEQLIKRVINNEKTTTQKLKNYTEYKAAKLVHKATCKVGDMFKKMATDSYEQYLVCKSKGIDNIALLLQHNLFRKCTNFYYDESNALVEVINEYFNYLTDPINFFSAVIQLKDRYLDE